MSIPSSPVSVSLRTGPTNARTSSRLPTPQTSPVRTRRTHTQANTDPNTNPHETEAPPAVQEPPRKRRKRNGTANKTDEEVWSLTDAEIIGAPYQVPPMSFSTLIPPHQMLREPVGLPMPILITMYRFDASMRLQAPIPSGNLSLYSPASTDTSPTIRLNVLEGRRAMGPQTCSKPDNNAIRSVVLWRPRPSQRLLLSTPLPPTGLSLPCEPPRATGLSIL